MEQVRMPPAPPQAAPRTPAATSEEKRPEAGEAATERKDGFALLLAALGNAGAATAVAPDTAAVPVEQPAQVPLSEGEAAVDGAPVAAEALPSAVDDAVQAVPAQQPEEALGAAPAQQTPQVLAVPASGSGPQMGMGASTDGESPAADAQVHDALQEHLNLILDQGRHAQLGQAQALSPDAMIRETARIDAATPSPATGLRRSAGLAAGARFAAQGAGLPLQVASAGAQVASGDGTALSALTGTDADVMALDAGGTNQPLRSSLLDKMPGGDARVPLQQGGSGTWTPAAQNTVSVLAGVADGATARTPRVDAGGGGPAHGGAGSGGHAGLPPAPLQQGSGASAIPGGAGAEGGLPGSFMEQLGEQVAFWVHQKSQRAEFTLDRDGDPVQVQLSLLGDVAKVAFLSDHAAARQVLDAGIEELRERLQQQGIELADVSVDVAKDQNRGNARQDEGDLAPRGRATGSARVQAPEAVAGAGRSQASHRAVDIFV